jgi:hypothetical protein
MATTTPLSSALAVLVCVSAIVLGVYLIVDGIRHPAIGHPLYQSENATISLTANCGWILWDSNLAASVTCNMKDECEGQGIRPETDRFSAIEGYDTKGSCETAAVKVATRVSEHNEKIKKFALKRGRTSYTKVVVFGEPECWPVGHDPNDK